MWFWIITLHQKVAGYVWNMSSSTGMIVFFFSSKLPLGTNQFEFTGWTTVKTKNRRKYLTTTCCWCGPLHLIETLGRLLSPAGTRFTCDFMLPELVVLVGLLHRLDGRVVDVQQFLHGSWRETGNESGCTNSDAKAFWTGLLLMLMLPLLITAIEVAVDDELPS